MSHISQTENRWYLSGDMHVENAVAVLESSKALSLNAQTIIDFSAVNSIDTSTISLILEWKRRAATESKLIQLENMPTNLKTLAQLYGVTEFIQ